MARVAAGYWRARRWSSSVGPSLHRTHAVPGPLFERAKATLGEQGVVDLIGVSGYYTLVSMVLNVAEIPLPEGVKPEW